MPERNQTNFPNALTLLRILLVPAFLISILYERPALALFFFLLAGGTDLVDGMLARRLGQETLLGTYLDPLADKLLMTVSFVALSAKGLLPAWLAVITVSKDVYVSLGVAVCYFSGQRLVVEPTFWGKQTTFWQMATVGLVLLVAALGGPGRLLMPLFGLTALLTIFSALHYLIGGLRLVSRPEDDGTAFPSDEDTP